MRAASPGMQLVLPVSLWSLRAAGLEAMAWRSESLNRGERIGFVSAILQQERSKLNLSTFLCPLKYLKSRVLPTLKSAKNQLIRQSSLNPVEACLLLFWDIIIFSSLVSSQDSDLSDCPRLFQLVVGCSALPLNSTTEHFCFCKCPHCTLLIPQSMPWS